MRKNFGAKPILYPQPVFILGSFDENGSPNAMNAAWGGISETDMITMCIGENHKTTKDILKSGEFTVSMGVADQVVACDYVGIASGNNTPDKMARTGWTAVKAEFVNAPIFEQLPMALECKLVSYDPETACMIGKVVNVNADESVLTDGKIDPFKLRPLVFDANGMAYHVLGEKVGNAFSDGKKLK